MSPERGPVEVAFLHSQDHVTGVFVRFDLRHVFDQFLPVVHSKVDFCLRGDGFELILEPLNKIVVISNGY